MATILLIRHAAHAHLGNTLSGRTDGIALADEGRAQARLLALRLAADPIVAVHSSPVQRARETAAAIAGACGREVEIFDALDEIDFGQWTGRRFDALAADPEWTRWNLRRGDAAAPGGESMAAAQARALRHVRDTAARWGDKTVAMVTHCDIIRAVVAAVLGLSLDHILRFEIDPASVSRLAVDEWGERVISLNEPPGG